MRRFCVILLVVSFASLLLLASCGRRDYRLIPKDKFQSLMVELYVADGYFANIYDPILTDSVREAVYNNLFAKHGTTRRDYDSTLAWYGRNNLEEYITICQAVRDELERQRVELDGQLVAEHHQHTADIPDDSFYQLDSINLLVRDSARFYHPDLPFLNRPFVIKPAEPYAVGSRFEFVTRVRGLQLRPEAKMEMALQLVCVDNTSVIERRQVDKGLNVLSVSAPDSLAVAYIYGYLRGLPDSTGMMTTKPFLVDSFSFRKFGR